MKVAIPQWQGRVSPVLDTATRCVVVEMDGADEVSRRDLSLSGVSPRARSMEIAALGADLLVCGALSRPMAAALNAAGVKFRPYVCGPIGDVLAAVQAGRLDEDTFAMPGCCGQRRRSRRRGQAPRRCRQAPPGTSSEPDTT